MTTTIEAIYENGMLKLPRALDLPDKSQVLVTIRTAFDNEVDPERSAWLQASREKLARTWDNTEDDVFNELLDR